MRPWQPGDLGPFAALNADPLVMEHLGGPRDSKASDALAERLGAHVIEHGFGFWAVEVRATAAFAGFTGLQRVPFAVPSTPSSAPAVEIGWRLARGHWGRGYATEAARASLSFGFEALGLGEITAFTTPANLRSRRVMERLGMTRDPDDDFDHPALPEGSPLRRHVLYRLRR